MASTDLPKENSGSLLDLPKVSWYTIQQNYGKVTSGVAQDHINDDNIVRLDMPEESRLFCFVDDITVVITARNREHARRSFRVIRRMKEKLCDNGLELAISKAQ